jgi:hypothetical protein
VLYLYCLFYLVPSSEGIYNVVHAIVAVVAFWLLVLVRAPRVARSQVEPQRGQL